MPGNAELAERHYVEHTIVLDHLHKFHKVSKLMVPCLDPLSLEQGTLIRSI